MKNETWVLCPICRNKTRIKVLPETVLIHFPLYCPKCRQECLIEVREMRMVVSQNK